MIKLLQLECISYRTGFSLQAAAISQDHIPRGQWHLLYFAYGKYNKSCSCGSYSYKNDIKRTGWSSGDHLTLKFSIWSSY